MPSIASSPPCRTEAISPSSCAIWFADTDWQAKGLPKELNLRISLHAGPVYCYKEPVFKELEYAGSHIVRAARIEPITPPGQVYASQQFAALASTQRVQGLHL